jgi:hypothetical protein
VALLTPLAIFVGAVWSLNRIHKDSEIVVAQAAGMTRWQVASPILRLALMCAVMHLAVNLWVQPTAQRTMREAVAMARADLAAALARLDSIIDAPDSTPEADERATLGTLVSVYEEEHHPFPALTGTALLANCMEAQGLTQTQVPEADLAPKLEPLPHFAEDVFDELLGRWREVEVPCDLSDALALLEHQRHRARLVFRATPEAFRTGWFIESLLTEVVVALVVRTQRPVLKSRPGKLLLWTSVGVAVMALAVPFIPGASVLGFVPVPVTMLLTLAVMTAASVMTAEGLKRRLFPALMSGRRAAAPS